MAAEWELFVDSVPVLAAVGMGMVVVLRVVPVVPAVPGEVEELKVVVSAHRMFQIEYS